MEQEHAHPKGDGANGHYLVGKKIAPNFLCMPALVS